LGAIEIVEFGLDESGRFFVVKTDDVEDGLARYGDLWVKDTEYDLTLRGAKALSYAAHNVEPPFLTFTTSFLNGWYVGRVLRTQIASFYRGKGLYVSRVDLDESTGRFLVAADYSTTLEEIESACRIYLADLPD